MAMTQAQIDALIAENARLKEQLTAKSVLTLKVGPKGGIVLYGLQRNPVSLYVEQWERLIEFAPEISKFAVANDGQLSRQSDDTATAVKRQAARTAAGVMTPEESAKAYAERTAPKPSAVTSRQATPEELASLDGSAAEPGISPAAH